MRPTLACLAVLCLVLAASGTSILGSETVAPRFFRSDQGVTRGAGVRLPDRLDAPGVLRWMTPVDPGHSTPVLAGGRLVFTTYRAETRELATEALDATSGRRLWRRVAPAQRIENFHMASGGAAQPSPASDGSRVFVLFGSHGLLAYDLEGRLLWERPLGPFQDEYGAGSSPILAGGKLVVLQDHDIDSFLMAVDPASGTVLWRVARPDAVRSYSTPVPWTRDGHTELLVAGALQLTAYHLDDGRALWSAPGLARIVIPVPVPVGDRVYMASWAPGGDAGRRLTLPGWTVALERWDGDRNHRLARAEVQDAEVLDRFFRMDLDQSGDLTEAEWQRHATVFQRAQNAVLALRPGATRGELSAGDVLWKHARGVPYVASPLVADGALWMVKDGGIVTRLATADGQVQFEERLPAVGNYHASPVAGDGKIYFASDPGVVSVVASEGPWRVLSSTEFRERIRATPVIEGNRLYLRTDQAIRCFGVPDAEPPR